MLLSIVMMIKNEEKYLDKTLKALLQLMNDINSELVILDTGSTDRSREIAKKYTNKVYFDKWNDNFADMRNKSISYANGDWILIVDADEELIKYDKLVEFFNSSLCKEYNSASIELKSLSTEDKDIYSIGSSPRLFKNDKGFRYEGAIHEQPMYKQPMYNNIAYFNHYGYMYSNEEIKNKKLKRNEKILISEYNLNPNDSYICYQLGQNYAAFGEKQEALYYLKKSYGLYKEKNQYYIPVQLGLAKIYLTLDEYEECEKICIEYIKNDDKNIDMYYYLALSQYNLRKYNESLNAYNRYLYLIENFEISTQAKDVCCVEETICYKEYAQIKVIEIYYNLNLYENVINECEKFNLTQLKKVYKILFKSLYKLKREKEILNIYNEKSEISGHKKEIRANIEKLIENLRLAEKEKMYLLFTNLDDSYGILNKVRLGEKLSCTEYNEIILKENDSFYADLIYYALEDNIDINTILSGVSYYNKQSYLNYLVKNRRDCIFKLYNYLLKQKNTLDIEKLSVYSVVSKILFLEGNLKNEKCEKLFLMYIVYHYEYLKQIYNSNLTNEQIFEFTSDKDDIFVINIILTQKIKDNDKLGYIKALKKILIENNRYKDGIKILINKFDSELKESKELLKLKQEYKSIIENSINNQNLDEASQMIEQYESMFDDDYEILNMKAIVEIMMNKFDNAEMTLKNSFLLNNNNYNTIFNIAYLKEISKDTDDAMRFYIKVVNNCKEGDVVLEAKEKINLIAKIDYI